MLLGWCQSPPQGPHRQTGAKIRHNIEYNTNYAPGGGACIVCACTQALHA
jgi:hypothetical protein